MGLAPCSRHRFDLSVHPSCSSRSHERYGPLPRAAWTVLSPQFADATADDNLLNTRKESAVRCTRGGRLRVNIPAPPPSD